MPDAAWEVSRLFVCSVGLPSVGAEKTRRFFSSNVFYHGDLLNTTRTFIREKPKIYLTLLQF